MKKLTLILILFFMVHINVYAACSNEELNTLNEQANNVITDVELSDINRNPEDTSNIDEYVSFIISFYNLNDNLRISQANGKYTSNITDVEDGRLSIRLYTTKYNVMKFNVVSASNTCNGEVLREMSVTIPQYNELANDPICDDIPDFYYCRKVFTTPENISYEEFQCQAEKYRKDMISSVQEEERKNRTFIEKYGLFVLLGVAGLSSGIYGIVQYRKNKKINKRGIV